MTRKLILLIIIFITSGCSSPTWYVDYGITESEFGTDKAIIAAGKALMSSSVMDRKGAIHYLETHSITAEQAKMLAELVTNKANEHSRIAVANSITQNRHYTLAIPYLRENLSNKSGLARANAARVLGEIGCDAKDVLPLLKVVSSNDGMGVQKSAKIAYREISLDCMNKNISTNE